MLFVGLDIGGTNIKAGILDGESAGHVVGDICQERLPGDRTISVRKKLGGHLPRPGDRTAIARL